MEMSILWQISHFRFLLETIFQNMAVSKQFPQRGAIFYVGCIEFFMQSASMNSASLRHATRGCVASATGDSTGIATCNGALAMQGGVAGQTSALPLRVAATFCRK